MTPSNREQYLYDDIIDLDQARREHQRFRALLSRFAEVLDVRDLLADFPGEAIRLTLLGAHYRQPLDWS